MTAVPTSPPAPVEISDEDVVRRVVAGEKELFELLLRRYNQRVYRTVRAVLRNPEDAEDVMQHVEAEVAALPEAYRSVLLLRQVEGLSTEETAECLEVSTDVVKTRLHRARAMLRDALYRRAGAGLLVAKVMEQIRTL